MSRKPEGIVSDDLKVRGSNPLAATTFPLTGVPPNKRCQVRSGNVQTLMLGTRARKLPQAGRRPGRRIGAV